MWEYKVVFYHIDIALYELENGMNRLGKEGWELIGCDRRYFFFKRPKEQG